jgi:hypothetical protein
MWIGIESMPTSHNYRLTTPASRFAFILDYRSTMAITIVTHNQQQALSFLRTGDLAVSVHGMPNPMQDPVEHRALLQSMIEIDCEGR